MCGPRLSNVREVEIRKANGEKHAEAINNIREIQGNNQIDVFQTRMRNDIDRENIIVAAEVRHAMNSQVIMIEAIEEH